MVVLPSGNHNVTIVGELFWLGQVPASQGHWQVSRKRPPHEMAKLHIVPSAQKITM
jgi:hypothetical protein